LDKRYAVVMRLNDTK